MVNVFGFELPFETPSLFGLTSQQWLFVSLTFMFVIVGFVILYFIYMNRLYNRKIIVFENISGQGFQPTIRDSARLVRLGDGGEELMYLRRKKVFRTAYGKKMGINTYWFAVGQDGYWYNVTIGDIDAKMGMLDIEPIDRDMRYMHVAVRKNIEGRYKKVKFMEKYGTLLINGIFALLMIIAVYFILEKVAQLVQQLNTTLGAMSPLLDRASDILTALDNLQGGGGIKSAG